MDIKAIVERNDTLLGHAFDLIVQVLILLSVITFSITTLPDLNASIRGFLDVTEVIVAIVFTCEYFLLITLILLYLSAVGIYYFKHEAQPEAFGSIFHSLWWDVATLSTVGYGDMYPITVGRHVSSKRSPHT